MINNNMSQVGFLGTMFTMEQDFYKGRLKEKHGIDVVIPDEKEKQENFYHGLILGLMLHLSDNYYIESNKECVR